MPLARRLFLLPLALAGGVLVAQEPAPTAEEKPQAKATEARPEKDRRWTHTHRHRSVFGLSAQGNFPQGDLKETLNRRTGLGLGAQWTHDHGDWNASRTRMEWNTFPEGRAGATPGTTTYAKNYILSFDHLFKLNQGNHQAYVVGGLGGARWCMEQTTGTLRVRDWTTKLVVTAGLGLEVAHRVNLEARYAVSSVDKTFDANVMQISVGWRF